MKLNATSNVKLSVNIEDWYTQFQQTNIANNYVGIMFTYLGCVKYIMKEIISNIQC